MDWNDFIFYKKSFHQLFLTVWLFLFIAQSKVVKTKSIVKSSFFRYLYQLMAERWLEILPCWYLHWTSTCLFVLFLLVSCNISIFSFTEPSLNILHRVKSNRFLIILNYQSCWYPFFPFFIFCWKNKNNGNRSFEKALFLSNKQELHKYSCVISKSKSK